MRLALDTNRYTDLARNIPDVVAVVEAAEEAFLPFVVFAELRAGFTAGTRSAENEEALRRFLSKPGVGVLYPDEDTVTHYARLWKKLRDQGTPIPVHDLWIAAIASQHGLTIYARDRHFQHLPQIPKI